MVESASAIHVLEAELRPRPVWVRAWGSSGSEVRVVDTAQAPQVGATLGGRARGGGGQAGPGGPGRVLSIQTAVGCRRGRSEPRAGWCGECGPKRRTDLVCPAGVWPEEPGVMQQAREDPQEGHL